MTTTNEAPAPSGSGVTAKLLLKWADDFAEAAKKFERLEKFVLLTRAQECRDAAASLASDASPRGEASEIEVERVEMEDWSKGYAEEAEPIWRIVLNGYCADFPSEGAARNFAAQIAALYAHPAPATVEMREAVREAIDSALSSAFHCGGYEDRDVDAATDAVLAALAAAPATEGSQPEPADALPGGWVVANGTHTLFRCWIDGLPGWTPDRDKATRYVRRSDAEAAHQEDIDAWGILPFHEPAEGQTFSIEHDGFTGTVQGYYVTREGKQGVVLQQVGTKVVHVYGRKWLKPNG